MAAPRLPQLTINLLFLAVLAFSPVLSPISAANVTDVLAAHPDLSDFARLLSETSVADDLAGRSSLTLLAVPNQYLRSSLAAFPSADHSPALPDVLRYHVLLQFLSWSDLRRLPPTGRLVTTLLQTTGRAHSDLGAVNLTADAAGVTARSLSTYPPSNATFLTLAASLPYNLSIFAVDSLLLPYGFDLAASSSSSSSQPPSPRLNITSILLGGQHFNVAAAMLAASGAVEEFEADEHGAGITIFAPTDAAFADLPPNQNLQSLSADRKLVVLKFHVLHSYYPLGSLDSIVNPVQPTLATEDTGAGTFTLNITRVNGFVAIDTGLVQAAITQTVFDQNPLSVFAVSKVLLPKELFGPGRGSTPAANLGLTPPPAENLGFAPPPAEMGMEPAPASWAAPPLPEAPLREIRSSQSNGGGGGRWEVARVAGGLLCTALYVLV